MKSKRRYNNCLGKSNKKAIESPPQTNSNLCFLKDSVYISDADEMPPILRDPPVEVPSPDAASLPKQSLCSEQENSKPSHQIRTNVGEVRSIRKRSEKLSTSNVRSPETPPQTNKGLLKNGTETAKEPAVNKRKKRSTKKKENEVKCHQLTEYFPVRRSNRKTVFDLFQEKQKYIEEAVLSGKEDGFEIKEFPGKGRGVISIKNIKRGDFVLEYYGELIDMDEAKVRERLYSTKENTGCYMYYFKHQDKQYCVDATKESGRLGRLVNHSKKGNLKTVTFFSNDTPHLILVASKDISAGEELLYDYGDRSKVSLEFYPWLAL